jgi:hypothetical protein
MSSSKMDADSPWGNVSSTAGGHINVVQGGLQALNEKGDDGWRIANAIIVVSMDDGK